MGLFPFFSYKKRTGSLIPPPPANWWELPGISGLLVAYQPRGAASYSASLVNLVEPGVDNAIPVVAPVWNKVDGWRFEQGANSFIVAGSQNYGVNDTILIQYDGWFPANFRTIMGGFTGSGWITIGQPITDPSGYLAFSTTFVPQGTNPSPAGNGCIAGPNAFSDGIFNTALVRDGYAATPIGIGDGNNGGAGGGRPGVFRCRSYGHYSGTLSNANILAVANAMAAQSSGAGFGPGIEMLAHTTGTGTDSAATTYPINTTGANFLIAAVCHYGPFTIASFTDSKGNTWNALNKYGAGSTAIQLYWSKPTTVGTGHTVSVTGTTIYPMLQFAAFSGVNAAPFDQQSGAFDVATPGALTPANNNSLIVTAVCSGGGPDTVTGGFSMLDSRAALGGVYFGGGMAYTVQGTAASANPTWSATGNSSAMAVFKP